MARKPRRRAHGQGTIEQRGANSFFVRWYEGGKKQRSDRFETYQQADQVRAQIAFNLSQGRAGIVRAPQDQASLGALGDVVVDERDQRLRSGDEDLSRWNKHIKPALGDRKPSEVTTAVLHEFVLKLLHGGLSNQTVKHCMKVLSAVFDVLCLKPLETGATVNPVRALPKHIRRLYRTRSKHKDIPFIEEWADVEKLLTSFKNETIQVMFAIGVLCGVRPSEIKPIDWVDVNLKRRRIRIHHQVYEGKLGPLKDDDTRFVPILNRLLPILEAWKEKTGGVGPLFKPLGRGGGKPGKPSAWVRTHTMHRHLKEALKAAGLPQTLTWYQTTRHTFASQWVAHGRTIESLAGILGHSTTWVTERYAHLKDQYHPADYAVFDAAMKASPESGTVSPTTVPDRTNSDTEKPELLN